MDMEIRLEAENGYLCVNVSDSGTCRCACESDTRLVLGAESRSLVLQRLAKAVGSSLAASGLGPRTNAFGYDALYVLMLTERHHALYVAQSGSERVFLWIDAQANPPRLAAALRLTEDQRQQWLNRLTAMVESAPPAGESSGEE
jgi:hypothetical protein